MDIIIKSDHISIHDDGEEMLYWTKQEWHDDPDTILPICNAIVIALTDPELARETFDRIQNPQDEDDEG